MSSPDASLLLVTKPIESRWAGLSTEARHPASARLDRASTEEVVALLLAEDRHGIERAEACRAAIASAFVRRTRTAISHALVICALDRRLPA